MPTLKLKCNRCECVTNAPSIRPGDLCPHCNEGEMVPAEPVVFDNYREFTNRLIGLATVTIQKGVYLFGDIMTIGNHAYYRSPLTGGWQPYQLTGNEVFNVIRGF